MKITSSVNCPLSWRASEIRDTTYIEKRKKATPKFRQISKWGIKKGLSGSTQADPFNAVEFRD